jgi:hypothetical protein
MTSAPVGSVRRVGESNGTGVDFHAVDAGMVAVDPQGWGFEVDEPLCSQLLGTASPMRSPRGSQ